MIRCDIFELRLSCGNGATIDYLLWTDLPAGTRVMVTCKRSFINLRNETRVWMGYNDALEVKPSVHGDFNGLKGTIDIRESDQIASSMFDSIQSAHSAGIQSKVSDEVVVVMSVGGRQRLRAFGKNNESLSGQMVDESASPRVVRVSKSLVIPMDNDLQPILGDD